MGKLIYPTVTRVCTRADDLERVKTVDLSNPSTGKICATKLRGPIVASTLAQVRPRCHTSRAEKPFIRITGLVSRGPISYLRKEIYPRVISSWALQSGGAMLEQ